MNACQFTLVERDVPAPRCHPWVFALLHATGIDLTDIKLYQTSRTFICRPTFDIEDANAEYKTFPGNNRVPSHFFWNHGRTQQTVGIA
ncbi:hypothetical protein SCLCIDRAFT_1222594 [Scleroderma citrinum Foug A]|uniref:Uncharacterized protein n=1 Tax=Scleroderma citrinum Foug A TaxID=1036808 RepID=A0A0C2ZM85_9AGAM|nr:hypothetical protein SCLCIDRAFT_1222594 [Scleroderma citrinum Foug A]